MPDTFSGFMTQRFRWVYGAMQIIKGHWRQFHPYQKITAHRRATLLFYCRLATVVFLIALALLFTTGKFNFNCRDSL